jgi:predicted RecB family nuclease
VTAVEIAPQSASFAKACPQRVQLDVLQPCEPLPDPPFLQKLFRAGHAYEDETVGAHLDGIEGAQVVEAEDADAREFHTTRAVSGGARLVAGGRLPVDYEAHRVGEPDLLVLDGDPAGAHGYLPVDIKSHKVLDAARKAGAGTALVSDVDTPFFDDATMDTEYTARWRVDDLLQLAHYRRLLEEAGWASPLRNVGGVCGSEGAIVWYDLDEPCLDPSEYLEAPPAGRLSAMELYDLEFAHRLAVHAAALEQVGQASPATLLAEPIVCSQCDMCRWREWCSERLEEVADLSLLSGIGAGRRRAFKAQGIGDLHELAALDWRTAELVRCKVDLGDLLKKVRGRPASTPLADAIPKRKKQLDDLASLGFVTVADLDVLDPRTLDVCASAGGSNVATQIEAAQARVGASAAYRRRGVVQLEVPRGDVEVDVDMESTNDGCYLWGALVTDRRDAAPTARYVSFATWDPEIEAGEVIAFKDFWSWFRDERARTEAAGATFRAYCYSRGAEQGQMTRLADRVGLRGEVDAFLASDAWVDLLEVTKGQLLTGRSMGLKETAPLAGFAWRFDDAGGNLAMVRYDEAVDDAADPATRNDAQQWILRYNEDDVRATAALRAWLDGPAGALPSIAA